MGSNDGPSPLIPSIMLGAFGLFKYGTSIVSYLGFFVGILEGMTGGGGGDEEGEEEAEEEDSSSVLTKTFYMCTLTIVALALMLLLLETNRLYRQHYHQIQQQLSSGHVADGIMLGVLILVVFFIVMYNDLV